MITSGHWITLAQFADSTVVLIDHWASLAEAWRWRGGGRTDAGRILFSIISRCPAPMGKECTDCWMAEIPF